MADLEFIKHCYNGHQVRQRISDDYVNLTDLAKSEGRRVGDYLALPDTKAYIQALASDLGVLPENLVTTKKGSKAGTYAHPEIAMDCAQWVSMPCRIWANRTLVQVVKAGGNPPQVTPDQIVALLTRSNASAWKERFEAEFYEHLSRLTNLEQIGHKRPKYWAALTNEFVYDLLPEGVADALRKCRTENGGWDKLHQYLSPEGLAVFQDHMRTLIRDMEGIDSINQLRRIWSNRSKFLYRRDLVQLALFNDYRKDGKLTKAKQVEPASDQDLTA